MSTPIDINTATFEQLKQISGISDKRANKIIKRRQEKGSPLTLEDLKLMSDIPNTMWDPLIQAGVITVLKEPETIEETLETSTEKEKFQHMANTIDILKNELESIKKDKNNMQAAYDKKLADITLDFKIKLKNTEHEYNKQHENYVQQQNEKYDKFMREFRDREEILCQEIKLRDIRLKKMEEEASSEGAYGKLSSDINSNKYLETIKSESQDSWKKSTHISKPLHSTDQVLPNKSSGPLPPKMATYDGRNDWRPYFVQFNHIANRYNWTNQQRLDKLIECLRDKALKFFTSRSTAIQEDYQAICKKLNERFGSRDLPHIVRRQLQDLRQLQEESLEEYAERAQEMATDGYPGTPDAFIQVVAIDAFLKGCSDKKAALTAMDKDPDSLDQALQYVKCAITNQRVILGQRKLDVGIKRVTFQESDTGNDEDYDEPIDDETQPRPNIRIVYKNENATPDISRLEARIKKTEDDLKETKSAITQILDILKGRTRTDRSRSPSRTANPGQSPTRDGRCFNCGLEGHYISQCDKPKNRSPQRYNPRPRSPSPNRGSNPLNFNGLKM